MASKVVTGGERRLRREDRRAQILDAATDAFARAGFAATSLDDIATEARVSRVILYRHFDSKADLYRQVLDRVCSRLADACGCSNFTEDALPTLIHVAAEDPGGFRLLFQHAAREPEFRDEMSQFRATMTNTALTQLTDRVSDPAWGRWAAQLSAIVAVEAIIAWLDAGQPDPDQIAARIRRVLDAIPDPTRPLAADQPGRVPTTRRAADRGD
jgi:AcrR family transcriptional regulator